MKCNRCIAIITAIFLIAVSGLAAADVLPGPAKENQVFTVGSTVEGVGAVTEKTDTIWEIGDKGIERLPAARGTKDGKIQSGSIALATYSDFIMSNGGQIADVKSFSMDTNGKTAGLYNIDTAKVLTYTSQNGSHLMGRESYVLDVAGNWSKGLDDIVCVFSKAKSDKIPAFCNKVTASSKLLSITTAQIETQGRLTAVGKTGDVPAALQYEISVVPDANSASGYADGIVSTTFTVHILEGRSDGKIRGNPVMTTFEQQREGPVSGVTGEPTLVYRLALYQPTVGPAGAIDPVTGFRTNLNNGDVVWLTGIIGAQVTMPWTPTQVATLAAGVGVPVPINYAGIYTPGMALNDNDIVLIPVMDTIQRYGGMGAWEDNPDVVKDRIYALQFYDQLAATLTFTDTATLAGGISNFNKDFDYKSGVACTTC